MTQVTAGASGVASRVDVGNLAGLSVEIQYAGGWRTLCLYPNDEEPRTFAVAAAPNSLLDHSGASGA